jgi:hypothetical protein
MARYSTRIASHLTQPEAFRYMADLRNFPRWDPGVRAARLLEGDPGVPGALFELTLSNPTRTVLRYRTLEALAPRRVVVEATTWALRSVDTVTVEEGPGGQGSVVIYDAALDLRGPLRLGDPGLRLFFEQLGDRAAAGLARALSGAVPA